MRPPTACVACRNRRRKCEITTADAGCDHCVSRGLVCSLSNFSVVPAPWPEQSPSGSASAFDGVAPQHAFQHHRESISDLPPQEVCEELVNLYLFHINDKFHSLFHPRSLIDDVARGTLSRVILLAIMSLSARFSTNFYFGGLDPRLRGKVWAQESSRLLDLRDVSLTTVQACVLLGACAITEGEAAAEAVYYSVACRMAMLLDLAGGQAVTRLEREVNIRVWWSLCMIDVWSSAGVRLPRSIPSAGNTPWPMEENTFLQLRPGDRSELSLGYNCDYSLLTQMIRLNAILAEINTINELAASTQAFDFRNYNDVDLVSRKLDDWQRSIPDEMQDTPANLARYGSRQLGPAFVAVYLGYYNYGQMLYYQFLHGDCHDNVPHVRSYANKCKAHAQALCEIIYRSYEIPGCEVSYTMVGHILVIASTIQLHTLLFDVDEQQIRAARRRLERNFEILTRLQSFWPSLDICFSRLKEFHKACQKLQEKSFKMDQWMLKFLLEFAKPVGEKEMEEIADLGPWTMQSLGIYNSPTYSSPP